jgi:CheY-like chemotaxis protein
VDDDSLVLDVTVAMLEELGHTVIESTSADQALKILRRNATIDLVVTDHAMPVMTGAKLAEVVTSQWPNLKVILTSGYAELRQDTGFEVVKLAKPFRQQDLARAITLAFRQGAWARDVLPFPKSGS